MGARLAGLAAGRRPGRSPPPLVAARRCPAGPGLALILLAFGLACRALDAALPYRGGLREYRRSDPVR